MSLARAVARSNNAKIGDAATTYAAQASCPTSCAFLNGGGCYAENGRIAAAMTIPLNAAAQDAHASTLDVARAEAREIDQLEVEVDWPMRLHTVGDCATDDAAILVGEASERYMNCGGGPVWTYTHAWRDVDRASWGKVSVLASCETTADFDAARERGYAPSIVVDEFPGRRKYLQDGEWILPCPAQTTADVTCSSCRLCFDDDRLFRLNAAIGFAVHGTLSVQKAALKALRTPDDPDRRLTSKDHANRLKGELGRWPTARELMDAADVTHASAWEMLKRLQAKEKEAETRAALGPRLERSPRARRSFADPADMPFQGRRGDGPRSKM